MRRNEESQYQWTGPGKKVCSEFSTGSVSLSFLNLKKHGIDGALTDEEEEVLCQNLLRS
jgi:hypothetical protein